MSDLEPNAQQQRLIDETEGTYLVDAGAGTGKTLAVTRRYANIIDQPGVEPDDVLLATFTTSAATEMRERIVEHSGYGLQQLADAPIRTFHSHAHHILDEHGYAAPRHLGIDDRITGSTRLIEDELVETELFREFIGQFQDAHPEYADQFRAIEDHLELLDLVTQLAAKGIIPTREGWYRDSREQLAGAFETFKRQFDAMNQPRNGGRKQSPLREKLGRYGKNKTYLPDAPTKADLRGGRGTKQLDPAVAKRVFDGNRSSLTDFVHDVYLEYLEFALGRNYLNFGFLQVLAYVLLLEDHDLRARLEFEYVMVDEFQDTSEIQFKLALLLAGTENFAVVGDWKQSIYAFQYADVDNIRQFEKRLQRFSASLNDDSTRVNFETPEVTAIRLSENYRSTQSILDFSKHALTVPATDTEAVENVALGDADALSSNAPFDQTHIEAIQHEAEHEAVLAKIQDIVGNDAYSVADGDGNPREPEYGDIAVLTRTREYGRELLRTAEQYDFPMAYDGGVELFRTDPAKVLLAWLRILESNADRGWAVVLEAAGYTLDEIDHVLSTGDYPAAMTGFRSKLAAMDTVASVARRVFDRYGFHGEYADVILDTIESVHQATTVTRGDLIRFITRAIDTGATHEVATSAGEDSVTVQTIHAAKGLEYPIVVMANMNDGRFPPSTRDSPAIRYEESVGLRQRQIYAAVGEYPHVYDNWRDDVLRHCLPDGYDEERRLLYVAITRAKQHLVFAGGEDPNRFLESLPVDLEEGHTDVAEVTEETTTQAQLPFTVSPPDGPVGLNAHDLMDESVFEEAGAGETSSGSGGVDFGTRVHEFAEQYARDGSGEPETEDEKRIADFIDSLDGELSVEAPVTLPLTIDDQRVTIAGIVDLVHVTSNRVAIIDYKTDRSRRGVPEYAVQLSVYYHVLGSVYPDRSVDASLYFTADGERVPVEPTAISQLRRRARDLISNS
ncbi:UvrD-helicase domain-containing protein [Halodesulfurarchaeum formicicum]|uniref:DNA 3'-5' helicase n=1 Tax=Halodesulfurarchaeum formicicum TaxID=1873524 RepID=A0A1J1AEU7_9EURY|nr:ATP-dependent DNA helicase [Halodesulfurarchaeum formicicum]APE96231.1 ATP-dependent DNA helicase PcrA [Halodesulfurarchaeum formicicum]